MTKKTKAKIEIKSIGEVQCFGWQDAIITFNGDKWKVAGHHEPQDVVSSAFRDKGKTLCTRKRDFGGCGKDALKPEIVPFATYLAECGELLA